MSDLLAAARFKIDVDEIGRGTIEVNGEDVTARVVAWQVGGGGAGGDPVAPQFTSLILRLKPGSATVEGAGIVQLITEPDDDEQAATIRRWLSELDPEKVESAVLALIGSETAPTTNGEAWLAALGRMVEPT